MFFQAQKGYTDKNCEEFKAWCYRVAKNYFVSYCIKQKNSKEVGLDFSIKFDGARVNSKNTFDDFTRQELSEDYSSYLKACFSIVIDLKSGPHIVLTWISFSMFILE